MKLSQAKEYLPFVQAAAEGKTIQWKEAATGKWHDYKACEDCWFSEESCVYRIKPEPKLRPWRPEEVPIGALIRNSGCPARLLIVGASPTGLACGIGGDWMDYETCMIAREYSTDGGKTWKPCGVQE